MKKHIVLIAGFLLIFASGFCTAALADQTTFRVADAGKNGAPPLTAVQRREVRAVWSQLVALGPSGYGCVDAWFWRR